MLTSDFSSRFGERGSSYSFCYLSGRGLNDLKNHIWLMIFMSIWMMVEFQQKRKETLRVLFKTPLCFIFLVISHFVKFFIYSFSFTLKENKHCKFKHSEDGNCLNKIYFDLYVIVNYNIMNYNMFLNYISTFFLSTPINSFSAWNIE